MSQLDMFHDPTAEAAKATARAVWVARFAYAEFCPLPYRGVDDVVRGPVCPACGKPEWNSAVLWINHGYDVHTPGPAPYGGEFGDTCFRIVNLRAKGHPLHEPPAALTPTDRRPA